MSRTIAILLACVVASGAPATKPKSSDKLVAYIPTTVGDKWVTVSVDGDNLQDETVREVTAVERQDGALLVTTERRPVKGTGRLITKKRVSEAGEFLMEEGKDRYDPPVRLLPMPIKEKDTWKWEKPGIVKWTYTAGPEEDVEVPAGKFRARRVDGEGESEGKPVRCTQWLVPGHPTIKTVLWLGNDRIVDVLKSFTSGKKE